MNPLKVYRAITALAENLIFQEQLEKCDLILAHLENLHRQYPDNTDLEISIAFTRTTYLGACSDFNNQLECANKLIKLLELEPKYQGEASNCVINT